MIVTYVTYALLIALIIWGIKFPGFGNKFNEDFLDRNSTKAVSGLAAILVIFHHLSQEAAFQDVTKELFFFNDLGYLICTVFFFFSAYGLTVSANNNPNYIKTFSKRFITILVPFYVLNIIYGIYGLINGMPVIRVVLGILGLVNINSNGWFPFTLLLLYLVFYLCNKTIKNRKIHLIIYFVLPFVLGALFSVNGHFAWWADSSKGWWLTKGFYDKPWWMQEQVLWFSGEWWVNSSIGFFVGALFGTYKEKLFAFFKKGYWIKLIVLCVLFGFTYKWFVGIRDKYNCWTEYWINDPGILNKLITVTANQIVSLVFIFAFIVLLMKFRSENPVTRFMGKISFETYLIGKIVLEVFRPIILNKYGPIIKSPYNYNLGIYVVCVVSISILLGFLINKLDGIIIKKLTK
ncbi:MAG: acyltransferase family protein [Erysipelotrichaceae bacterium]|nr:acyltransferase family protein [Erysipelotrichaceae bacterium]